MVAYLLLLCCHCCRRLDSCRLLLPPRLQLSAEQLKVITAQRVRAPLDLVPAAVQDNSTACRQSTRAFGSATACVELGANLAGQNACCCHRTQYLAARWH
jgi:hypothetical protein